MSAAGVLSADAEETLSASMETACQIDSNLLFEVEGKNYENLNTPELDPTVLRTFLILKHLKEAFTRIQKDWTTQGGQMGGVRTDAAAGASGAAGAAGAPVDAAGAAGAAGAPADAADAPADAPAGAAGAPAGAAGAPADAADAPADAPAGAPVGAAGAPAGAAGAAGAPVDAPADAAGAAGEDSAGNTPPQQQQSQQPAAATISTQTPPALSSAPITYAQVKHTLLVMLLEYQMSLQIAALMQGQAGGVNTVAATKGCESARCRLKEVLKVNERTRVDLLRSSTITTKNQEIFRGVQAILKTVSVLLENTNTIKAKRNQEAVSSLTPPSLNDNLKTTYGDYNTISGFPSTTITSKSGTDIWKLFETATIPTTEQQIQTIYSTLTKIVNDTIKYVKAVIDANPTESTTTVCSNEEVYVSKLSGVLVFLLYTLLIKLLQEHRSKNQSAPTLLPSASSSGESAPLLPSVPLPVSPPQVMPIDESHSLETELRNELPILTTIVDKDEENCDNQPDAPDQPAQLLSPNAPAGTQTETETPNIACIQQHYNAVLYALEYIKFLQKTQQKNIQFLIMTLRAYLTNDKKTTDTEPYKSIHGFLTRQAEALKKYTEGFTGDSGLGDLVDRKRKELDDAIDGVSSAIKDVLEYLNYARLQQMGDAQKDPESYRKFKELMKIQELEALGVVKKIGELERALVILKNQKPFSLTEDASGEQYLNTIKSLVGRPVADKLTRLENRLVGGYMPPAVLQPTEANCKGAPNLSAMQLFLCSLLRLYKEHPDTNPDTLVQLLRNYYVRPSARKKTAAAAPGALVAANGAPAANAAVPAAANEAAVAAVAAPPPLPPAMKIVMETLTKLLPADSPDTTLVLAMAQSYASAFKEGAIQDGQIEPAKIYTILYGAIDAKTQAMPDKKTKLGAIQKYEEQTSKENLFVKLAKFNEDINTVRIVMNYRTVGFENEKDNTQAGSNYNGIAGKIQPSNTFVSINNLIEIQSTDETSTTLVSKDVPIGPFYQVFNSETVGTYEVGADLQKLDSKEPQHLIYSAYGFSGSGKTYTMFGAPGKPDESPDESLLGKILEGLKSKSTDIKYRIYDYYGEKGDDQCIGIGTTVSFNKTLFYKNKGWIQGIETLQKDIIAFNEKRRMDLHNKENNDSILPDPEPHPLTTGGALTQPEEKHIRATPNNPDSSRSHLFVDIEVEKQGVSHRITLIDMAGAENVDTIQGMYFEKVPNYDLKPLNSALNALITKLKDILSTRQTDINTIVEPTLADNFIDIFLDKQNNIIPMYFKIDAKSTTLPLVLIKPQWESIVSNTDNEFLNTYNLYNFIKLIKPIYRVYKVIEKIVNAYLSSTTKNKTTIPNHLNIDRFNQVFSKIKLQVPISNETKTITITSNNDSKLSKAITVLYGTIDTYITTVLRHYIKDIETIQNMNDILKDYYTYNTDGTLTEKTEGKHTIRNIDIQINKWNDTYIKNIHCPLRFQGNFIMKTLEDMKASVGELSNAAADKKTFNDKAFPGSVLYANETQKPPTFNTRLTLFVNTRLDFDPENTDDKVKQDAYRSALAFAVQNNPLMTGDVKDKLITYKATGGSISVPMVRSMRSTLGGTARAEKFVEGLMRGGRGLSSSGGAKPEGLSYSGGLTASGGAETLPGAAAAPATAPAPASGSAPADAQASPQVAIDRAKKTFKDLNDIKKDLIAIKNVMEGLGTKVDKFKTFKEAVVKTDGGKKNIQPTEVSAINDAIGAYKYMKDEGTKLKQEFKETVDSQLKQLESIQKRLTTVLEAEASTPAIRNDLELITTTFEQSVKGAISNVKYKDKDGNVSTKSLDADNTGLINTLKGFYQTFATDFDEAYSFAKQIAEPVIEQKEREAKLRASNPAAGQDFFLAQQEFEVIDSAFRPLETRYKSAYDNALKTENPSDDINSFIKHYKALTEAHSRGQIATNRAQAVAAKDDFNKAKDKLEEFNIGTNNEITKKTQGGGQRGGALTPDDSQEVIKKGIDIIDGILTKLIGIYKRQSTPGFALSGATGDNLFTKIFNEYMTTRTDQNEVQSRNRFMEQLEVNNLIPRKVLAITTMDRILFVFITLFIRTLCTAVIVSLIERGTITQMVWAITGYMIMYSLILIAFVLMVNLDMYRMRIVFNYVNFHANSGKIYMHLGLLVLIGILIYIVITRINFPIRSVPAKAISDNQKVRLIMRFQILTGILWAILALIVALESA